MFKSMIPPISYYGGKQKMAKNITPLIPQHTVYVEPFCGGATILFKKPWPSVTSSGHYREVINDLDSNLIHFFKTLRDNCEELCKFLELTPFSEQIYQEYKSKNFHKLGDLERAAAYWYNIMTSFSYKLDTGFGKAVFTKSPSYNLFNKINNLNEYISRMRQLTIMNSSALDVIKKWDSPQTFFYCDPPYPNTDQRGYINKFSVADFQELVNTLENCQGSFMLSCYELDEIQIPETWDKFQFKATNCSKGSTNVDKTKKHERKNTERIETVYRRFNKVNVRPEIQKLYDSGKFDCYVAKPEGEK